MKTTLELIVAAQDAVARAQKLIVEHPSDPNAAILELNEAYGLLETVTSKPLRP